MTFIPNIKLFTPMDFTKTCAWLVQYVYTDSAYITKLNTEMYR